MINSINDLKIGDLYQFAKTDFPVDIFSPLIFDIETFTELEQFMMKYPSGTFAKEGEIFLLLDIKKFSPPDPNPNFNLTDNDYVLKILYLADNQVYTIGAAYNGKAENRFALYQGC